MNPPPAPSLRSPDPETDLSRFPARSIPLGSRWKRAHRVDHEPWYCSSHGTGRFDLAAPHGTCYLATTAETAAREIIGPDLISSGQVTDRLLANRVVTEIELPTAVTAAKLTADSAFAYRVSNELSTVTDYGLTQQWAAAFHRADFDGIWYRPRFSPGSGRALAVFDASGARENIHLTRQTSLANVVRSMPGITVLRTDSLSAFTIIDDPQR